MKTLTLALATCILLLPVACKKGPSGSDEKKPKAPEPIVVQIKDKRVTIDKALAFWTDDWTLRIYGVTKCPTFKCTHIRRGWRTKEFKKECPDAGLYGVQFRSHWGVKMRPGKWEYQKTDNEPVDARPYTHDPKNKVSGWWSKGGVIELVSLTDKEVSFKASFTDSMKRTFKAAFSAPICAPEKKPKALTVTELMPPPHKPLTPKAKLLELKPKLPAKFEATYEFKEWFPTDGSITWNLKKKGTNQTVLSIRIRDKRNYLYERSNRSEKLFGKYPMTRFRDTWMWTYVGNFNIDVSTTGYKDATVKKDAVIDELFKSLPLDQFEKL
ncbi:MAG: hypothetical protein KC609_23580 [Myxococcales bacterium]|nr:hypothetical protein [Myxococcales bacterium]